MFPFYRQQSIDLLPKTIDGFLYEEIFVLNVLNSQIPHFINVTCILTHGRTVEKEMQLSILSYISTYLS